MTSLPPEGPPAPVPPADELPIGGSPARPGFFVTGIGFSAGGLEALESLLHRMAPTTMAVIVVPHLSPDHDSLLAEILRRSTSTPLVMIESGMPIEPRRIYVTPPNADVAVEGGMLQISSIDGAPGPKRTIDRFFRSLAHACGPMAIGVVLSGAGSDGTLGLKAIKAEGGITFAQEPSTAAHPSMAQSALDAGFADFSLPAGEIGEELARLGADPEQGRTRVDHDAVTRILAQVCASYGVDFAQYKPNTIERRIGRRMAVHKLDKVDEYLERLQADGAELRFLYNDLLIGVTSFFRDADPFQTLRDVVFPRLFENRSVETPIRMWIAGCATGEEAYSIAIALLEFLGDRAGAYNIQIFATDVDDNALQHARVAFYPPNIEIDVSPERLQRFFVRTDKGYQVRRQVRDLVVFARHNLGKDPPFSRLDFITCRNVLIYMQTPLQRKVLRIFHYALNPDAYLLLGTSESVGDATELFWLLDRKVKIYIKKNTPATAVFEFSFQGRSQEDEGGLERPLGDRPSVTVTQLADRRVMEKYAPPGVIVNDRLDITQFRGRTGPYLEPAPGLATLNLLKLVRPELLIAMRATLQKALSDGLPAASPPISLWGEHGERTVSLDAMPLPASGGRRSLLVLFNEVANPAKMREPPPVTGGRQDSDPKVVELEHELSTTKEYLQSTIEELEAANEELQSSNEELQSSNEELQSAVEELETSKEELQSTNEELTTVNDELQSRMGQLSVANDHLQNLLTNTSSSVVIVGDDLRIRRFSAAAEKLLDLVPGDVGRPIAYLRNVMSARDVESTASDTLTSVAPREQRVRCIDGSWYLMKMMPYVTTERRIRGIVIEFVKTAPPAAESDSDEVHPLAQRVLSAMPQPIVLIDRQLRLVWANRCFFETFAVSPAVVGGSFAEAWGRTSDPAELWVFLEELVANRPTRDILIDHPFGRDSDRPVRFRGASSSPATTVRSLPPSLCIRAEKPSAFQQAAFDVRGNTPRSNPPTTWSNRRWSSGSTA